MKKYVVKAMHVTKEEEAQLHSIGVDEGVELFRDTADDLGHVCFITVDNTRFCLRKKTLKLLELEELTI